MNQPTTPDLSGYGAQVIEENGRFALTFWPYCAKCQSPFQFDAEPFAYCSCGTTEWGDPRPASWVCPPRQPLNEEDAQLPKGAHDAKYAGLMDEVERAAINRYRLVPPASTFAYGVVGGNGMRKLFTGTKAECGIVARKLTEAFLDGAHMAISACTTHVAETDAAKGEPS